MNADVVSYTEFLEAKRKRVMPAGVHADSMPSHLFDFQAAIVRWALARGRAGIYADTGLGKTHMQLAWADRIADEGPVILLAPIAVGAQTAAIAESIGIDARVGDESARIMIINYERLHKVDPGRFVGVVLDESSILKSHDGRTRTAIISAFSETPYRLSCSATPSPNDFIELANQAEFLGVMSRVEMLATWFTHDGGETSKWRLKNHGRADFWKWMASWSVVIQSPADIGFDGARFAIPALEISEHVVTHTYVAEGDLFEQPAITLTDQRAVKRETIAERCQAVVELIAREPGEQWLVWCHLNAESEMLANMIPGAVEVRGSSTEAQREAAMLGFSAGDVRVLVSKPSICGFGMNWQNCARVAFVGLSHSFEQWYQAIRRCWRYGQARPVHAHLITADGEGQVLASVRRKESQHREMVSEMVTAMGADMNRELQGEAEAVRVEATGDVMGGEGWDLISGDCVEEVAKMPDESIDYTIFSPPFASLYTYSASDRDMGNSADGEEFADHFRFLVPDLLRVTKPGRLVSFHCMNLPTSKARDGVIGLRDFRGELIRMFSDAGWIFHSEVCIWKDPVTAMQRTKALGLLHKQLKKDSAMSRQGIPDYLVTMRKPGDNPDPVSHTNETFPVSVWQRVASPVWMDINPSRTLQYRAARENEDERHICPLQLDVIERCVELWSNPGDLVLSPFAGIGSEGYVSLQMGRRFVGVELKRSYFDLAAKHLEGARRDQGQLFA